MGQEQVPVLIVGAGAAGLSLSLLLLQQGVHPLLIERRDDISIYPRARNLNFRSMEVLRGLGLAAEVRAAGTRVSQTIFKETLASKEERIIDATARLIEHPEALSPDPFAWHCLQSRLEPLLRATARQRGGDVRYSTDLVSFTHDDAGVTATLEERATGRSYAVRAVTSSTCAGPARHRAARGDPGAARRGAAQEPDLRLWGWPMPSRTAPCEDRSRPTWTYVGSMRGCTRTAFTSGQGTTTITRNSTTYWAHTCPGGQTGEPVDSITAVPWPVAVIFQAS